MEHSSLSPTIENHEEEESVDNYDMGMYRTAKPLSKIMTLVKDYENQPLQILNHHKSMQQYEPNDKMYHTLANDLDQ